MEKFPMVSIIVVNFNGISLLENCFKSLKEVKYPNFEIILVDNGSSDGSVEYIEKNYPKTCIIKLEKNYGFAYPNNLGVKSAKGEYILFLNNDTKVTCDFILEMIQVMELDKTIGICQSMLLTPQGEIDSSGDFIDSLGICFNSKKKVKKVKEIFSAKGASMMIRRNLFEKLNGFDDKFYLTFEDVDLGWRAQILNYKVVIIPKSIVYHFGNKTINEMRNKITFHSYKNQISMKITNYELGKAIKNITLFSLIYGIREIKIWLDYKIKGNTTIKATEYEDKIALKPSFRDIIKTFAWVFRNFSYLHQKRKWISKNRVLSTKQIMEKFVI